MQNRKSRIAADILGQVISTFSTPSFKSMSSKDIKKYVRITLREGGAAYFAKPTPDGKITDEIVCSIFRPLCIVVFHMATRSLMAFLRLISSSSLFVITFPLLGNQHCTLGLVLQILQLACMHLSWWQWVTILHFRWFTLIAPLDWPRIFNVCFGVTQSTTWLQSTQLLEYNEPVCREDQGYEGVSLGSNFEHC